MRKIQQEIEGKTQRALILMYSKTTSRLCNNIMTSFVFAYVVLKSTQYKKLVPNALRFTYQNLKSCKPHGNQNKKHQNAKSIGEKLKTKDLMFFVSFFFHVISKISSFNVNGKAFVASFLY